jgi:hypothetical protein
MARAGYMGPHFGPVPDPPSAKFLAAIADRWDVLGGELGVDRPYKTFYPGQVFRWDFIEALVAFPAIEKVISLGDEHGVVTWHEVVYPTMAVRLGADPRAWPEPDALRPTRRDRTTWARLLQSPDVYLVHKVAADRRAPDRRLVQALEQGRQPDLDRIATGYSRRSPIWSPSSQWFSERFTAGERVARVRRRLRKPTVRS